MNEALKLLLVFAVGALPWGEVALAIPMGIGLGLHPLATLLVALLGNVGSVLVLQRLLRRWSTLEGLLLRSKRTRWAASLMTRYGIVGLAAQAPILSGAHPAMVLGLLSGASLSALTLWLAVSIAGWGVTITLLALQGKRLVMGLLG